MDRTTVAPAEALRSQLHGMWASVAPQWGAHAAYVDQRAAALTAVMLERTAPLAGERALELACGPGSVGIAVAPLVGSDGEVVLSDVAPEMVAIAAARAAELDLTNVTTSVLDLEAIDEPDRSFDVVLCREGLMFATDPAHAVGEIRRVLRPGGRFAISVWGPRDANPWLAVVLDAVSAQLGVPVPPPGIPGPFSLDDPSRFRRLFDAAGFAEVQHTEMPVPLHAGSFDEWWTRTRALAGPLANVLAGLGRDAQRELETRLGEAAMPFQVGDGLEFPGVVLLATGTV
jgi:ubiquinone/menaquinone biosynthesis C-methylase UbiE